jgi:hypothetical protein
MFARFSLFASVLFDDRLPDPFPNDLPFQIATVELGPKVQSAAHEGGTHQVGAPGRSKLGIVTMLLDQELDGSPVLRRSWHSALIRGAGNYHTN